MKSAMPAPICLAISDITCTFLLAVSLTVQRAGEYALLQSLVTCLLKRAHMRFQGSYESQNGLSRV